MTLLLLLAAASQYQVPPAPPAQASGGAALESELRQEADRYRAQCYSENAIKIMVDSIRRLRTAMRADVPSIQATDKELADAAYAEPFDKNRMLLAIRARAHAQAVSQAQIPDVEVDNLNKLPKADQVIYARSISGVTPVFPPKPCS